MEHENTKMVNMRLPIELIDSFGEIAAEADRTKTAIMKIALERGLANIKEMGLAAAETLDPKMVQVVANVPESSNEEIVAISKELGFSRARIIANLIESGLEDTRFLKYFGLRPKVLQKIAKGLGKLGFFSEEPAEKLGNPPYPKSRK